MKPVYIELSQNGKSFILSSKEREIHITLEKIVFSAVGVFFELKLQAEIYFRTDNIFCSEEVKELF